MAVNTKNRRKLLKRNCPSCDAIQDIFADKCSACGTDLLKEGEDVIRDKIAGLVDDVEEVIKALENGTAGAGAYKELDRAAKALKTLKSYHTLPGMEAYTDAAKEVLQPHRLNSLNATFRGNLVFFGVLMLFPILPLAFGWDIRIIGIMFLPALFWAFITFKAFSDLQRAKRS